MPYRGPQRSYLLPVVTTLAVAAPLATLVLREPPEYRSTTDSNLAAIPTQLTEMALAAAPDVVLPLRELTGLDLPDLRLSDLRRLPLPRALPVPAGLPNPLGGELPTEIQLPRLDDAAATDPLFASAQTADPSTPALAPGAVAPELTDQVGAEVKQLRRDTPFSVVALTGRDLAGTKALVRARKDDGSWGSWYDTERVETSRNDRVRGEKTGTEPVFVGATKAVQVLVTHRVAARGDDPAQLTAKDLSAVLIDPGRGPADRNLAEVAAPLPGGGPRVISRAQWGADESLHEQCSEQQPAYDDFLGGITVHHTAGRNDYSPEESAGIVRAIFAYHAKTLGWCDIGYNALVDKYGQVFEGRFGGLDRPVQGAHAGGFNENTAGVAIMGDFQSETPSEEAVQAAGQFIGWRARVAGLDPRAHTTMISEGTDYTFVQEGESIDLPVVFAHRDVGNTTCPGDAAYGQMDRIREIAAAVAGTPVTEDVKTYAGAADPNAPTGPQTQQPQRSRTDLAALARITTRILNLLDKNAIANHYVAQGGPNGRLGAAASDPIPTRGGGQYVRFVNGYVYAAPDGTITEVAGRILDRFIQLGAESGILGLPVRGAHPVPGGTQVDFQYGSLLLDTATGLVTTLLKSYGDHQNPATIPAPIAHPAPTP
ncbi:MULTISPECIES: N-acetylmuramoyl-L-alanine amidase [Nocardia]|uniref:N-acetylmuramoyl-L-alanine amidase n=1 Tax=Nocardia TaxID=1817 RepID=UPI0027E28163|nr:MULTISPECIES: N-acetylmuramoyl-L-alanine amidase [Nocardia]